MYCQEKSVDDLHNFTEDGNDTSNVTAGEASSNSEQNNFAVPHQFSGAHREETNELPERDAIPPRQPYHYTLRPGYKKPRPVLGSTPDLMIYAKNRYSSETPDGVRGPVKNADAKPTSHGSPAHDGAKQGMPLRGPSHKTEPVKYDHEGSRGKDRYESELRGSGGEKYRPYRYKSNALPDKDGDRDGEWAGGPHDEDGRKPGENSEKTQLRLPVPAGYIVTVTSVKLKISKCC